MKILYRFLLEYLREFGIAEQFVKPFSAFITFLAIFIIAFLAFFIVRRLLVGIIHRVAKKTRTTWDDVLVKNRFFNALAHFVPALILMYSAGFSMPDLNIAISELTNEMKQDFSNDYYFFLQGFLIKLSQIYLILTGIFVISRFLNASVDIYNKMPYAHQRPVKGYAQLVKILVFFLAAIFIISAILGKDPTVLIAGLGALAAVLLLIFKDTILGFVASIQLTANKMVSIGDWIEMPGHRADGTVIDITLNTVKVQNWDNTITTIPTYALVSESFNNWKGMEESGGRRIKRSILIDMNTIKFCTSEMLAKFEKFEIIRDYVKKKEKEIREFNEANRITNEDLISGRRQTNIGIFRKYLEEYLLLNKKINMKMTFLIRHLQPGEKGLPVEIYAFSKDKSWAGYEAIQADIFDHILAVIPEFELRIFQLPSGSDLKGLIRS